MNWYDVDLDWAYGDLLGSIHRQTKCLDRAYDVLHDALIRLALVNGRTAIAQPHAYLRTVVRTVLARQGRDMGRWLPFPDSDGDADGDAGWTEHPDITLSRTILDKTGEALSHAPSPEHMADLNQRLRTLQRIIDCLPPRCREVFWLFHVEGYTQPEIAARLSISINMVERHVMRAFIDIWAAREAMS